MCKTIEIREYDHYRARRMDTRSGRSYAKCQNKEERLLEEVGFMPFCKNLWSFICSTNYFFLIWMARGLRYNGLWKVCLSLWYNSIFLVKALKIVYHYPSAKDLGMLQKVVKNLLKRLQTCFKALLFNLFSRIFTLYEGVFYKSL